jgi:hypothetical protein
MALYPITPPAGIIKNGTDYANTGRWVDGDLVRFENGYLKPIGGWREFSRNTPINYLADNTGTVVTSAGSSVLTVNTSTAHGASVGDTVLLSGFDDTGGISAEAINKSFSIASTPLSTTFTVNITQTATANASSSSANIYFPDTPIAMYTYRRNNGDKILAVGGRRGVYVLMGDTWYDITPAGFSGDIVNTSNGYGTYDYGEEEYGDARTTSSFTLKVDHFSFDNWGEHLVFCCSSDGKIYQWRPDSGGGSPDTVATQITNSPTGCQAILVSNERHLIAIGANSDPRKISWSDREDNTTWTSTARNTAGDLQIPTGGRALYAVKWQNDIIIFSDVGINRLYYVGSPFVYGIQDAGVNCKAISPRGITSSGNFIAWIGENSFFTYDGRVRELKSDVHDYIFDNIQVSTQANSFGTHNIDFNEIWWFFPVGDTDQSTPNKYVIWNYLDNVWSIGSMDRTCWIDQGIFDYPLSCDSNGFIYEHNKTSLKGSPGRPDSQVPFCQTAPIEIGNGDRVIQVNQIIPDEESSILPGITIGFKGRFAPLGPETDFGDFNFDANGYDGYTDARFTARQVSMKVTGSLEQDFQVGKIRVDGKPRGRR